MRNVVSKVHGGLAWIVVAAVVAQFFFAGLGIFGATTLQAHRTTGNLIGAASLLLLVLALVGMMGRMRIGLSALLFVLTIIQNLLVRGPSLVAALHPLNALAVLGVAVALARSGPLGSTLRPSTR
jgi:hypothetical protein